MPKRAGVYASRPEVWWAPRCSATALCVAPVSGETVDGPVAGTGIKYVILVATLTRPFLTPARGAVSGNRKTPAPVATGLAPHPWPAEAPWVVPAGFLRRSIGATGE